MLLIHKLLLICSLLFFIYSNNVTSSNGSIRPKAVVIPVKKDAKTLQHTIKLNQRTPQVPLKLTLDLGGELLWVACDNNTYKSSSFKPLRCNSAPCSLAKASCSSCYGEVRPGCLEKVCWRDPFNPISYSIGFSGQLGQDFVSISSTDGFNPGPIVSVRNFIFSCATVTDLTGLASGVTGVAALGWPKISLPYQFSSAFSFHKKFALCLSSSPSSNGVLFFGDGPYNMLPGIDVSNRLLYTPLIRNKCGVLDEIFRHDFSSEYYIGVKSIMINGKKVSFNTSLLRFDDHGYGGTRITTTVPYMELHPEIYQAVITSFAKELLSAGVHTVAPVEPFSLCFNSSNLRATRLGPSVPSIDLVLQNSKVVWKIFGANSMVRVKKDVLCLGVVIRELPFASIVIGGHIMEDNLLQFDIADSRLGFSSSLLFSQTTCSNFNFTSKA